MTQQLTVQDKVLRYLRYEVLQQMRRVLFEHLPRKEYHQKEDALDSQASSFPTLYLDGANKLFSVFQFLRKHELGV